MMKRDTLKKPFRYHSLNIEPDGKVTFILESRNASNTEQKFESQLSDEKVRELIDAISKSGFFSFDDDYSQNSKACSSAADCGSVTLTIKFDENEKTVEHYDCCFVKSWFSNENALQPLTDLQNKIDETVETKRWIEERK